MMPHSTYASMKKVWDMIIRINSGKSSWLDGVKVKMLKERKEVVAE